MPQHKSAALYIERGEVNLILWGCSLVKCYCDLVFCAVSDIGELDSLASLMLILLSGKLFK